MMPRVGFKKNFSKVLKRKKEKKKKGKRKEKKMQLKQDWQNLGNY